MRVAIDCDMKQRTVHAVFWLAVLGTCTRAGGMQTAVPPPLFNSVVHRAAERAERWFSPPSPVLPSQAGAFTWLAGKTVASCPLPPRVLDCSGCSGIAARVG